MRTFEFIKEDTGRWYVVLPEWPGIKEELEMVLGADTMLDVASENGSHKVRLCISEEPFDGSDELALTKVDKVEGAFYRLTEFEGKNIGLDMWLCNVTKFIFGGFPERIYIKNLPNSQRENQSGKAKNGEVILLQEQTLRRYEEELKQNPNSVFWKSVVKSTKEFIEKLKNK